MAEIDVTRMSSKGQIVIPLEMRKNFKEGEKILIIKSGEQIVLKKASELDKNLKEDLEFAKRTEEAYKRIESGEGIEMDFNEFIAKIKKW
jgi:AbrB family looped-hinge helix DNA binding protein